MNRDRELERREDKLRRDARAMGYDASKSHSRTAPDTGMWTLRAEYGAFTVQVTLEQAERWIKRIPVGSARSIHERHHARYLELVTTTTALRRMLADLEQLEAQYRTIDAAEVLHEHGEPVPEKREPTVLREVEQLFSA